MLGSIKERGKTNKFIGSYTLGDTSDNTKLSNKTKTVVKNGIKFTFKGNQYTAAKKGVASLSKAKVGVKSLTIPSIVKFQGITYKVTNIKANAFKNCKKLTTVTVGVNVRSIEAKAKKSYKSIFKGFTVK